MSKKKTKLKPLGPAGKLIQQGWCKGIDAITHKNGKVCRCSLSAINCSYIERKSYNRATDKLRKVIRQHSIVKWNDNPKRTKAEVLAAFRKAGV